MPNTLTPTLEAEQVNNRPTQHIFFPLEFLVMKIAQHIRDIGFTGHAALYRLSEPLGNGWDDDGPTYEYVVVSAAVVIFSGAETSIFGSNASGEVVSWSELNGSYRGGMSHSTALARAGYNVGVLAEPSA
jgi:hypothetical protein